MSYPGQQNYNPPPYPVDGGYCPPPPPPGAVIYEQSGNCPSCHQANLNSSITILGVLCAIFCFPCGLICLFLLTERRCPRCGYCSS